MALLSARVTANSMSPCVACTISGECHPNGQIGFNLNSHSVNAVRVPYIGPDTSKPAITGSLGDRWGNFHMG